MCSTLPWKVSLGKASTVNSTSCPGLTLPMSASETLGQIGLVARRIDLGEDLTCRHLRVKIDEDLAEHAGDLASHLDLDHRVHLTARRDDLRQRRPSDRGRAIFRRRVGKVLKTPCSVA